MTLTKKQIEQFKSDCDDLYFVQDSLDKAIVEHTDADQSIYREKALTYLDPRTFEVRYPDRVFANRSMPTKVIVDKAAKTYEYQVEDAVGMAEIVGDYSDDAPNITVTGKTVSGKIYSVRGAMTYTDEDVAASASNNTLRGDIIEKKRRAVNKSFVTRADKFFAKGDSDLNVYGLTNHPNTTSHTLQAGATTGETTWALKNGEEILQDFADIRSAQAVVTKGVHKINKWVMTPAAMEQIRSKPVGNDSRAVITELIVRYPDAEFVESQELVGAGAGSTDMLIGIEEDPDNFEFVYFSEFYVFPVFQKGSKFEQEAKQKIAGLVMYRPLSVITTYGI